VYFRTCKHYEPQLLPWRVTETKRVFKEGHSGGELSRNQMWKKRLRGCRLERVAEALRMGDDSKTNLTRNF
ncbi:unnamed protein product, partial [Musa acuminata subsp. burmannicoides]